VPDGVIKQASTGCPCCVISGFGSVTFVCQVFIGGRTKGIQKITMSEYRVVIHKNMFLHPSCMQLLLVFYPISSLSDRNCHS
jgi:hypothetical protein